MYLAVFWVGVCSFLTLHMTGNKNKQTKKTPSQMTEGLIPAHSSKATESMESRKTWEKECEAG